MWTSNASQNKIATGTVGGSAPDGSFALFSIPHGRTNDSGLYCENTENPIPIECYQNDGLKIESEMGDPLFAFGGRIDTANSGKVTFLLDGVDINGNDTDNLDNWQREGEGADNWAFVGVIETDGFLSAELRELRGKDFQQVFLFSDDFTIQRSAIPPLPGDFDLGHGVDGADFLKWQRGETTSPYSASALATWEAHFGPTEPTATATIPESPSLLLLAIGLAIVLVIKRQALAMRASI